MSPDIYYIIMIGQKHIVPLFWLEEVQNLGLLGLNILANTHFLSKGNSIDFNSSSILKLAYRDKKSVPFSKYSLGQPT